MMMWRAISMLAACGVPTTAPPSGPPSLASAAKVPADAAVGDASPLEVTRSAELGPIIDSLSRPLLQDHELTLRTGTERITLTGPASVDVAPLDDPAGRVPAPDGTWAIEQRYKTNEIVLVDSRFAKPVRLPRGNALIQFVGGLESQRTVVLSRSNWGWFVVRSQDGGATWSMTTYYLAGRPVETSRRTLDLVTRDGDWLRIDREGDLTTIPLLERGVAPERFACAAATLWVPQGRRLLWFDDKRRGNVPVAPSGQLICAGDDVLVPVGDGLTRCTHTGCGAVMPAGTFADLTSNGIATATQTETIVRVARSDRATVDVRLRDGEQLVGMVVWNDVPTLVLLGASKRLVLAAVR
jgi:hypothetical protein